MKITFSSTVTSFYKTPYPSLTPLLTDSHRFAPNPSSSAPFAPSPPFDVDNFRYLLHVIFCCCSLKLVSVVAAASTSSSHRRWFRWWDCVALPDDIDSSDEDSFRMQIKELAFKSLQLLKKAIFDKECEPCILTNSLIDTLIHAYDEDYFIMWRLILNSLTISTSSVEDYFLYIDDLKNPDKEEAEKITQPNLYALGEDYFVYCQGTAFFPLQSCMNHSCGPHAKAFKRDEIRFELSQSGWPSNHNHSKADLKRRRGFNMYVDWRMAMVAWAVKPCHFIGGLIQAKSAKGFSGDYAAFDFELVALPSEASLSSMATFDPLGKMVLCAVTARLIVWRHHPWLIATSHPLTFRSLKLVTVIQYRNPTRNTTDKVRLSGFPRSYSEYHRQDSSMYLAFNARLRRQFPNEVWTIIYCWKALDVYFPTPLRERHLEFCSSRKSILSAGRSDSNSISSPFVSLFQSAAQVPQFQPEIT
ncbi:Histone-lysine N-methyltransferase [Arachis hypogaea]|nr:Histone-lysine N-methyltransferase [Arachis hypogaea]